MRTLGLDPSPSSTRSSATETSTTRRAADLHGRARIALTAVDGAESSGPPNQKPQQAARPRPTRADPDRRAERSRYGDTTVTILRSRAIGRIDRVMCTVRRKPDLNALLSGANQTPTPHRRRLRKALANAKGEAAACQLATRGGSATRSAGGERPENPVVRTRS